MRPAFSSTGQALRFAGLLLALVSLPAILGNVHTWRRDQVYAAIHEKFGAFSFIHKQIFMEEGEVDMAFLGPSMMWYGIDAPLVKDAISRKLGREAEVFTFGWPWPGYDAEYFVARDLLERRRVNTLVIYDEPRATEVPHIHASRWYRHGEHPGALVGIPWQGRCVLYCASVVGLPRQLLSLLRPNLLEEKQVRWSYWKTLFRAPDFSERSGALSSRLFSEFDPGFSSWQPESPPPAVVFSQGTRDAFDFSDKRTSPYGFHFFSKLIQLVREKGTKLVILHLPESDDLDAPVIRMHQDWPERSGPTVFFVGIAPRHLFGPLPEPDRRRLFAQFDHLNENGQRHFTRALIPALLKVHDSNQPSP